MVQRALSFRDRDELRAAEAQVEEARVKFRQAITEARKAGATYALIGRMVGLSRQRVQGLIGGEG